MTHPLSTLKDKFGDKSKLVAEVEKLAKNDELWVSRLNEKKGLAHVSNAKLLRLHATFTAVKEKFGTRAKLIDAIAESEKRPKDEGFKTRLNGYPVPRLWDLYQSSTKRGAAKPAGTKTKAPKKSVDAAKAAAAAKPKKVEAPKLTPAQKKSEIAKSKRK